MNKYFYYNYLMVAFANLLVLVPYVLIQNRYNGTVLAIGFSFLIGMLLLFVFTRVTERYPNKDVITIIQDTKQAWFLYIFVSLKTIMSIISAVLVVGGYTIIVARYLNPDGNLKMLLILVLIAIGYAVTRDLLSIAYLLEFMMVVTIPFIIFILIKTYVNPIFTIDAVLAVGQHYNKLPNLLTLASATFMFSGFSHVALFNQQKHKPLRFKYVWPAPIIAFLILIANVSIPVGILGTETAATYLYVWSVATDATQMPNGFVERMMFIFILVLLSIAITYTVSSISQVIPVFKSMILKMLQPKKDKTIQRLPYYIYAALSLIIFVIIINTNDFAFEKLATYYLTVHFVIEVVFTLTLYIIVKVKGRPRDEKTN